MVSRNFDALDRALNRLEQLLFRIALLVLLAIALFKLIAQDFAESEHWASNPTKSLGRLKTSGYASVCSRCFILGGIGLYWAVKRE